VLAAALGACGILLALVISKRARVSTTVVQQSTPGQSVQAIGTPTTSRPKTESTAAAQDRPRVGALTRLLVAATRGDSWLVVRSGSGAGRVLYQGTLIQGKTLRLSSSRLWMRVGAGANLDVSINGKSATLGAGTFDAVLTPRGIRSS
jgi:uncharacterized protein DUF4115